LFTLIKPYKSPNPRIIEKELDQVIALVYYGYTNEMSVGCDTKKKLGDTLNHLIL